MRITIVYDNTLFEKGLTSDWGFPCFIESKEEPNILFDTGTKPNILLDNMEKLKISPKDIDEVFISHSHHDHTGGLKELLKLNRNIKVYIPSSFKFLSDNSTISLTSSPPVPIVTNEDSLKKLVPKLSYELRNDSFGIRPSRPSRGCRMIRGQSISSSPI